MEIRKLPSTFSVIKCNADRAIETAAASVHPLSESTTFILKAMPITLDHRVFHICLNQAEVLIQATSKLLPSDQGEALLLRHIPWFQLFPFVIPLI